MTLRLFTPSILSTIFSIFANFLPTLIAFFRKTSAIAVGTLDDIYSTSWVQVTRPQWHSGKVRVHECPVAIDSVPESLVQSQLNTIVKFLFTSLWSFTSSIYFILLLFTWRWSKTLLLKIHFTFVTLTVKSITKLAGMTPERYLSTVVPRPVGLVFAWGSIDSSVAIASSPERLWIYCSINGCCKRF